MLKIRFTRVGKKHDPNFRLVITDSRRAPRSGSCLENLGFYNPKTKDFKLKTERIQHWISKGAQVSDTAHNLLIKGKTIKGKKIDVSKKKPRRSDKKSEVGVPTEALGKNEETKNT